MRLLLTILLSVILFVPILLMYTTPIVLLLSKIVILVYSFIPKSCFTLASFLISSFHEKIKVIFWPHRKGKKQRAWHWVDCFREFYFVQVMAAQGTVLTNKYAGRASRQTLWWFVKWWMRLNSLPSTAPANFSGQNGLTFSHTSGAQANASVMLAVLKPGDKNSGIWSRRRAPLHGSPVNFR